MLRCPVHLVQRRHTSSLLTTYFSKAPKDLLYLAFMYPLTPIMHVVFCPPPKPDLRSLFFLLDDRRSLDSSVFKEFETLATLRLQSANEDLTGDGR